MTNEKQLNEVAVEETVAEQAQTAEPVAAATDPADLPIEVDETSAAAAGMNAPVELTEFVASSIAIGWKRYKEAILAKMGDTPENKEWLENLSACLRHSQISTALAASELSSIFQHYILGEKEIPLAVVFTTHGLLSTIKNHAHGLPVASFNVPGVGSDDPRWKYDPLPIAEVLAGAGTRRIPIRAETVNHLLYGYIELFAESIFTPDGRPASQLTNVPAIRVKDNYVPPSTVWRWFPVEETDVKKAWTMGKSMVDKRVKK